MLNYIKVIALRVTDLESVVVDEKNFKLGDDVKIQMWIAEQQHFGYICVQFETKNGLVIKV